MSPFATDCTENLTRNALINKTLCTCGIALSLGKFAQLHELMTRFAPQFVLALLMLLKRVDMQPIVLVIFFAFCQVIGTMCVLPDVSVAQDIAALMEEGVSCPMDGTIMCPPSIASSSERQVKHVALVLVDDTPVSLAPLAMFAVFSSLMLWAWSSAYSLVPISIASSSVLRI